MKHCLDCKSELPKRRTKRCHGCAHIFAKKRNLARYYLRKEMLKGLKRTHQKNGKCPRCKVPIIPAWTYCDDCGKKVKLEQIRRYHEIKKGNFSVHN